MSGNRLLWILNGIQAAELLKQGLFFEAMAPVWSKVPLGCAISDMGLGQGCKGLCCLGKDVEESAIWHFPHLGVLEA